MQDHNKLFIFMSLNLAKFGKTLIEIVKICRSVDSFQRWGSSHRAFAPQCIEFQSDNLLQISHCTKNKDTYPPLSSQMCVVHSSSCKTHGNAPEQFSRRSGLTKLQGSVSTKWLLCRTVGFNPSQLLFSCTLSSRQLSLFFGITERLLP